MSSVVLDASAILAIIFAEPGYEKLTPSLLARAVASTVNLSEAHAKLVGLGWNPDDAWEDVTSPIVRAVDFDADMAKAAGSLVRQTKALGLSLGDRACLAVGATLAAPVYTADSAWKQLKIGVTIHTLR